MPRLVCRLGGSEQLVIQVRQRLHETAGHDQGALFAMQELAHHPRLLFPAELIPGFPPAPGQRRGLK